MKMFIRSLVAVVFLAGCIGCIDSATMVTVNPDGTGEIIQKTYYSPAIASMMQMGINSTLGTNGNASIQGESSVEIGGQFSEEAYKGLAAALGEGVVYAGGGEAKRNDGWAGFQVKYTFDDITKVQLPMALDAEKMAEEGNDEKRVTFGFKKGAEPELTVNIPHSPEADADEDANAEEKIADVDDEFGLQGDAPPGAMAMMGGMMQGLRMRTYVMVNGDIKDSNASYVNASRKTGKKQLVTLLDMDIGKLMSDPAKMKKLESLGDMDDPIEGAKALKEFPEVKIELQKEISIRFAK